MNFIHLITLNKLKSAITNYSNVARVSVFHLTDCLPVISVGIRGLGLKLLRPSC